MRSEKNKILSAIAAAATCTLAASPAAAFDLTSGYYMTYGDANSYSLPINGPEVMSGPGQIDLYTKLGLQSQLDNPIAGMDNAYDTPSANNVEGFRMGSGNEPGGANPEGSWDRIGWWDSSLEALNTALDLTKNSPIFYFANNETGNGDNLAGWGRVELTHNGVVIGRYDLTNDDHDPSNGSPGYGAPPVGGGVGGTGDPLADAGRYTSDGAAPLVPDFLMSGGLVCADAAGLVDCSQPHLFEFQHNLGGDRAAYAVVFPELNKQLAEVIDIVASNLNPGETLANYALHVDYRLGCGPEGAFPQVPAGGNKTECDPNYATNGGSEKVFIGTLENIQAVPEPTSSALAALGLLGAFGALRRRHKA